VLKIKAKPRKIVYSDDGSSSSYSEDENESGGKSESDYESDLSPKKGRSNGAKKVAVVKSSGKKGSGKKNSGRKTRRKVPEVKERKYSWEEDSDDVLGIGEGEGSGSGSGSRSEADCELKQKINRALKSDSEENFF
jgi:hypothetical protein